MSYYPCCGNDTRNNHDAKCAKYRLPHIEQPKKRLEPPYFNENRMLVLDVSHPDAMKALRELLNNKPTGRNNVER